MALKEIKIPKIGGGRSAPGNSYPGDHYQNKDRPQEDLPLGGHIQNDSSLSLVAVDGDQVVGFIISEIMTNSFGLDQSGWIKIIGVHPKHMGTGIGQSLITQLFKQFKKKKINEIYTAARWDAVDMLSFFKSIGFDRSNFINLYKKLERKE